MKNYTYNLIYQAVKNENVIFTSHADDKSVERGFDRDDIFNCVFTGYIFQDNQYSHNYWWSVCHVAGKSKLGKPLCTIWAYLEVTDYIKLITLYPLDLNGWYKCHHYR